jgi:hypothetical protein
MSSHAIGFVAVVIAATLTTAVPAPDYAAGRRTASIAFEHPTWVADTQLVGTYVIEHDDGRMSRGEPCTILYRPGARDAVVVSFYCVPRERGIASGFVSRIRRDPTSDIDTLTEYQFAGDSEAHGVPSRVCRF